MVGESRPGGRDPPVASPPMRRAALPALVAVLVLAACGGDDGDDAAPGDVTDPSDISLVSIAPPTTVAKPEVDLPEVAPTELATTVLTEGSGIEAEAGDGILVRYVGVSFETAEEFDSNWGAEPLPVILGQGRVIAGWDEGLIGAQAGSVLQLDIPADQAYGPTETTTEGTDTTETDETTETTETTEETEVTTDGTGTTGETEVTTDGTGTTAGTTPATVAPPAGPPTGPLSFVVDVLAVVKPTDPADAPTDEDIPTLCPRPTPPATTTTTVPASSTPETTEAPGTTASGFRAPAGVDDTTATTEPADTTIETDDTTAGSDVLDGTCEVHVDEVVTDDLVEGDGPVASLGQVGIIQFVLARADNGVVLRSSWDDGQPTQLTLLPGTEMTGMITGIEGMKVGGRRVITVPYMDAFGERGFPTGGLPAETDVVVVVDLLGVYL